MRLLPVFIVLLLASCAPQRSMLLIQNDTPEDSLGVIVSLNGKEIFNGQVAKAISNFDAASGNFDYKDRKAHVEVKIPSLNMSATADSTIEELKEIYVSVDYRAVPNTTGNMADSPFLKKTQISIALLKDLPKGKAM